MTAQEIFDKVCHHLAQQKEPSTNGAAQCAYRGLNGRRCAVGILIPDDRYDPHMEGQGAKGMIRLYQLMELLPHEDLLMKLQQAHDNSYHLRPLLYALHRVAEEYHLDATSVGEIKEWMGQDLEEELIRRNEAAKVLMASLCDDDDDDDEDEEDEEPQEQEDEEDVDERELVHV